MSQDASRDAREEITAEIANESEDARPAAASRARHDFQHSDTLQVVLLDDEHPIRTLVRLLLKQEDGIELAADVARAYDAVASAAEIQPQVVLIDLDLKDGDGREILPDILASAPQAMVLVMSGLNAMDEASAAFELGAFAYVEKSCLRAGFGAELRRLYALFERARRGEDVWNLPGVARIVS